MNQLNLPPFSARIERREGKLYIWDILRQRAVRLTPEEWVRQHMIHYLIGGLGYPTELLMNEVALQVGETRKRVDSILYDRQLKPLMLLEYKSPEVPLGERVLQQALRYNMALRVPYLVLSNGLQHVAYRIDYQTQTFRTLNVIPAYSDLI
ncbi:MAG: type I restriction enzyme HsdR N-terminal domain-containing protein [Porphyromonas sp.]|nr:type I restriction enzyme HsdR N-terminal domain-containing protein [Porphyromonas sp.]